MLQWAVLIGGLLLTGAVMATVGWLVVDWGWLDPHNTTAMAWVMLVALSIVLAIGVDPTRALVLSQGGKLATIAAFHSPKFGGLGLSTAPLSRNFRATVSLRWCTG